MVVVVVVVVIEMAGNPHPLATPLLRLGVGVLGG